MLSSLFMSLVGRETLVAPDDTWSLLMVMCVAAVSYTHLSSRNALNSFTSTAWVYVDS